MCEGVGVLCLHVVCSAAGPRDFRRPTEEEALVREHRTSMLTQTSCCALLQDHIANSAMNMQTYSCPHMTHTLTSVTASY